MDKWYSLDNAGKLFPAVTTNKNTSIYRVSAILKQEINKEFLQQAVLMIADRFPMITMTIHQGVFWSYLEKNEKPFKIKEDNNYPCYSMTLEPNDRYLFRVLYYANRVSLEVFHMLTDGGGAMEYFKTLLWQYLTLCGVKIETEGKILLPTQDVKSYEMEDSFSSNYKTTQTPRIKTPMAYRVTGTPFENYGNNVIHGSLNAKELNAYAKSLGVTITTFLTALLIYSINEQNAHLSTSKPVAVAIPVNFRKMFESKTLRNFVGAVNVNAQNEGEIKNNDINQIIKAIDNDIKRQTQKDYLQNLISNNVKFEINKGTKLIPSFLKNICIGIGYNVVGAKKKTTTLSNLGNISLPTKMAEYIDSFEAILYPSQISPISCSVCSYENKMVISFTRSIKQADIFKTFFRYLSKEVGLDIQIYSNDWGEENQSLSTQKTTAPKKLLKTKKKNKRGVAK
ncbi:MAG: alcohol acetyltransferase [Oscillospiraceae bacterium]